jgi:DNA-directed RNA polymerase omega subunit
MANWAIVIGVDKYWRPEICLRGAVKDALRMRDWLLDENGGGVPHQNLMLLLSPAQPLAGPKGIEATQDNITESIERLLNKSNRQGERFFFHFSGHGLTSRINFSNQPGIVPTDFKDTLTNKVLTLGSLFELFLATQFKEQFFFIDACRNIPFDTEKRLGDYPNPRKPVPPVSPQFIMYATQPGVKAIEIRQPGNERGAFTDALLAGLRGKGAAKRWDEQAGTYVVRWSSLFEFVEREVKSRKLAADSIPGGPLIQEPRQFGERGSENPPLAHFAPAAFDAEPLEVDLQPQETRDIARIEVRDLGGLIDHKVPPLPSLPVRFQLPPRSYSVCANAQGYLSKRRFVPVDLYEPKSVEVELVPGSQAPPFNTPAAPTPPGGGGYGLADPQSQASLVIRSEDTLAHLELADGSGRILANGRIPRRLELAPGFYRLRLVSPEGESVEELIELLPGSNEPVTLSAAPPYGELLESIVSRSGFEIHPDHTISVSEAVGPSASLRLSTVLALAAAATTEVDSSYGLRLKALGLPPFQQLAMPGCSSGVQVVVGDESSLPLPWRKVALRCWRVDEPAPETYDRLIVTPGLQAVASMAMCRDPGSYWLQLRLPGSADLTMPVVVLPNHVSLIVLTFETHSKADLHQYVLELPPMSSLSERGPADHRLLDPVFGGSRFAAIRRIELMQRSVANGRITAVLPDLQMLLDNEWIDPVAGCLGGYLLLRMGKPADLQGLVENLTTFFGDLPDAHILRGAYLESGPARGDAESAYITALDRGLPIFRDGLALLDAAIVRLDIRHERALWVRKVFESVPAGSLWSFSPDTPVLLEQSAPLRHAAGIDKELAGAKIVPAITSLPSVSARAPSVDSKFRFVLLAARRAEQLMRGAKPKRYSGSRFSPTRVAMAEIATGLVEWGYGPPQSEKSSLQLAETVIRSSETPGINKFEREADSLERRGEI